MSAYDQLAHPPVGGLDREYLAYEDGRIVAAINSHADGDKAAEHEAATADTDAPPCARPV